MYNTDQALLVRALNSTRQTYFPTYVGLRLIGDQLPSDLNGYLGRMLSRRLKSGDSWRFKHFKLYKGSVRTEGKVIHEYRDCLASSPITALAEVYILALMADDPRFMVSDRIFSYRWPKNYSSGGSYAFFVEGYKQRNQDIAVALKNSDSVAVVTDIKSFYPSATKERVLSALTAILGKTNQAKQDHTDAFLGFYTHMLDACHQGIPIGPASSHVLGHLVLRSVDQELTERFGSSYFRYVDDIVVVCPKSEKAVINKVIEDCLERHGFSTNRDKTVELDGQTWEQSLIRPDIKTDDNFRVFTSDLAIYLEFNPNNAEPLKSLFFDNGLSIPVSRLLALSSYSRYRRFLRNWKHPSKIIHYFSILRMKNEDFLMRGLRLKATYEGALSDLILEPEEQEASLRRWQVQRIRRIVNTLFYLRDFGEWKENAWLFNKLPELIEQQALADALATATINPVLPFYGRGPGAFSELWSEYGKSNASFEWPEAGLVHAEVDSLISLQLHGVVSHDLIQIPVVDSDFSRTRILSIVNQETPKKRSNPDFSFEDEFESLRLGVSNAALSELARTRYSLSEGTALEALTLLSSEYRS